MRVSEEGIQDRQQWEEKGYRLPNFERKLVCERTRKSPVWIHFGGGNIFRAFLAELAQELLDQGECDAGVIVASGRESISQIYRPADQLCLSVTLKGDGTLKKKVIGSITESLIMESEGEDWSRLKEIFESPTLQMATFTITEKAYKLTDSKGDYLPAVLDDFLNGPEAPKSYMGKTAALCLARYRRGSLPLALVSMDNYSRNGEQLFRSVRAFAEAWVKNGQAEAGFLDYIDDPARLSFPWTMIDKITPGPDETVRERLRRDGVEGLEALRTQRRTNTSVFVNAEETGYLVVEDHFPNGRPPLEKAGVIFTDRETVNKTERMKVGTCLNPLHSSLAIFGCLLGYRYIWQEMKDPQLTSLIEKIGREEGLPVAENPGILDPGEFMDTVIHKRFSNPFVPDSPQRIAVDLSQKIPIRFGNTLKAYEKTPGLCAASLNYIPLVFAGYLRYLMGVDDEGNPMAVSPDPLKEELQGYLSGIHLGDSEIPPGSLQPILSSERIFGLDLYEAGLGNKVEGYFMELLQGAGAVRRTLEKYLPAR